MRHSEEIALKLTRHAQRKVAQRNISLEDVRKVVSIPKWTEIDKLDDSLTHFIGEVRGRFLRVIGRWEGEGSFLVVSTFYDRRLKRRRAYDPD